MTARAEYTDEEWMLLAMTPFLVGFAVSFSDGGGVLETLREAGALIEERSAGLSHHKDNELIAALLRDRAPAGAAGQQKAVPIAEGSAGPAAGLLEAAVDACHKVDALLAERSHPQEADGYKRFVMEVARAVAVAVRNGGLFSRGPLVDEAERAVLERVAAALGTEAGGSLPDERAGVSPEQAASGATDLPSPDTVPGAPKGMPSGPIGPE